MQEALLASAISLTSNRYNVKLFELITEHKNFVQLYSVWNTYPERLPNNVRTLCTKAWENSIMSKLAQDLEHYCIQPITYDDSRYPESLRAISDPPYVIYVKGNIAILKMIGLGCVGTRKVSLYGKRVVSYLLGGLRGSSTAIISGLALGVDAEVHKQALANSLPTIAVLGGGVDRFEPTSNHNLAQAILDAEGAIVSEYPPGIRPQKHHFLERNRIIAGLSKGVIVIEGKEHSGSLVTARYALAYGRELGVVPGDIFAEGSQGPLRLLRDGAWPLVSTDDVYAMLGIEPQNLIEESGVRNPIIEILQFEPLTLDSIQEKTGFDLAYLQQEVVLLELQGLIESSASGAYYLKR